MNNLHQQIIQNSEQFAKSRMRTMHSSHGWDHVFRVTTMADHIASTEDSADPFIVKVSALLHDIARFDEDSNPGQICHAKEGSLQAYDFLISQGLDRESADHVKDCILTHRFRNSHVPSTIEARILFDADKLDSIGAVGIGRAFLFSGEVGARLHNPHIDIDLARAYSTEDTAFREYMVKLRYVKDKMLTAEGKRIALERDAFMELFFRRIDDEVKGLI